MILPCNIINNDTSKHFSLIPGEVELENLPLKKDALSHFGLPIKAYSGSIGKIRLQVPVRQFRTAAWCISIEKVYIVCGPVNLDEVIIFQISYKVNDR
jgi:vacuolar protein sorting-associated protein 13D